MLRPWIHIALLGLAGAACTEREPPEPAGEPAATAVVPEARTKPSTPLFGFESRSHQLYIHSTDDGTFYTVKTKDGRVVAELIDEAALATTYPDLHDILNNGIDLIGTGSDLIDY